MRKIEPRIRDIDRKLNSQAYSGIRGTGFIVVNCESSCRIVALHDVDVPFTGISSTGRPCDRHVVFYILPQSCLKLPMVETLG